MELSKDQEIALDEILKWYYSETDSRKYFTLGGLAGSGKTFLINLITKSIYDKDIMCKIAHCAYTGKAADVMRRKGISGASTIHRLIYIPIEEKEGKITFVKKEKADFDYDLIIVDEASMVGEDIFDDLMSYGIKVLFVGDFGQLPPVGTKFNLMIEDKLDFKLTTIHRQALENPIISVSLKVREYGGNSIDYGSYKNKFYKTIASNLSMKSFLSADQIICGTNKRRLELNKIYREEKNLSGLPKKGEKLIILRNNYSKGVFNGQQIIVAEDFKLQSPIKIEGKFYDPFDENKKIRKEDFWVTNFVNTGYVIKEKGLSDAILADFGYCISVHKSQGSEWDKVLLIDDEGFLRWDKDAKKKFLYTAFTRAKEKFIWATD